MKKVGVALSGIFVVGCTSFAANVSNDEIGNGRFLHVRTESGRLFAQSEYSRSSDCRAAAVAAQHIYAPRNEKMHCGDKDLSTELPYKIRTISPLQGHVIVLHFLLRAQCGSALAEIRQDASKYAENFALNCNGDVEGVEQSKPAKAPLSDTQRDAAIGVCVGWSVLNNKIDKNTAKYRLQLAGDVNLAIAGLSAFNLAINEATNEADISRRTRLMNDLLKMANDMCEQIEMKH